MVEAESLGTFVSSLKSRPKFLRSWTLHTFIGGGGVPHSSSPTHDDSWKREYALVSDDGLSERDDGTARSSIEHFDESD